MTAAVLVERLYLAVGQKLDMVVVRNSRHLRRGNAATAVQRREDLAQHDHLAADAGFLLDQRHMAALVGQVQRGLHSRDAATYHQHIDIHIWDSHRWLTLSRWMKTPAHEQRVNSFPTGPISASVWFICTISRMKALVQTVQIATNRSRRVLIPRSVINGYTLLMSCAVRSAPPLYGQSVPLYITKMASMPRSNARK